MTTVCVSIADQSGPAEARREAAAAASAARLDATQAGKLSIVATEAATNVWKHGGGGMVLVNPLKGGVEILALDRGRGIADVQACLGDGYSTSGSAGTGMGAMSRLSTVFDVYSVPGKGTAVLCRVLRCSSGVREGIEISGITVPYPGETVCGDTWTARQSPGRAAIIVADGLGHGLHAAEASREAIDIFNGNPEAVGLVDMLRLVDAGLRSTRGAAVAVTTLDLPGRSVRFAGIGNIAGVVTGSNGMRQMVSHNGTAGHHAHRFHEFEYPFPPDGLLVLHSDGIATRWDLASYPGLKQRDCSLIAGVLFRDSKRGRDDATVVVARARNS